MTPTRPVAGDENGSIAVMAIVIMVLTSLVLVMLQVAERGMAASRRSGDSANALQVADAGINAAVQFIPTVPATQSTVGPITATVGDGTYTYSATKVNDALWNVTSLGTDGTGVQRRVVAQAVAEPLFGRPIYIRATASLRAGNILDSYSDATNRCTGLGVITVDTPGQLSFIGQGGGNVNCSKTLASNPADWKWSIDGCNFPGDEAKLGDPVPTKNDAGENIIDVARCPPEPQNLPAGISGEGFGTKRVAPKLNPQPVAPPKAGVDFPATGPKPGTSFECTATNPLVSGKTYYYDTIYLRNGCFIQNTPSVLSFTTKPTALFANNIEIGKKQGSGEAVNPPQSPTCPAWNASTVSTGYCKLWISHLQLNVLGAGKVTFMNSLRYFWGVINVPEGQVVNDAQQLEAWGASVSNSLNSGVQFSWHFDENLRGVIGTGRFRVANWREEGTGV